MKEIPVVFSINNNYAQHCGVAIKSILYNSKGSTFTFYILHTQKLSIINKKKIIKIVKDNTNSSVFFIKINKTKIKGLPYLKQFSFEAYNRIFFAKLLPNISKFIYLDSDIVVESNLKKLFNIKFKEPVAAIIDPPLVIENKNLSNNAAGFNSGVLIINTQKYISSKIEEKCVAFLKENYSIIKFADQDALNFALKDNWHQLPLNWNVQSSFYNDLNHKELPSAIKKKMQSAISKPHIIHYTMSEKPWNWEYTRKNKKNYYFYLKQTDWKDYKPKFKFFLFCKKKLKKIINKFK